ncbi:PIN domain-containing protein [Alteromonadaceae bacterium BrNp21-10]|nr:PIN domain-containing protein [Alteromonadaceae bacterium BrNp21-10]
MKALFDTCLVIDYLKGVVEAQQELARYEDKYLSVISWMQIVSSAAPEHKQTTEAYLKQYQIIDINRDVRELAVNIKVAENMKLPDAITLAAAQQHNLIMVTRNGQHFPVDHPGIRIAYEF